MEKVWMYDFSTCRVEETIAWKRGTGDHDWWVRDPFHPDNEERRMSLNWNFFLTEKEATAALLVALEQDKIETEKLIKEVKNRLKKFE